MGCDELSYDSRYTDLACIDICHHLMMTRRTNVVLSIAGTGVTQQLAPDIVSFDHSDDVERNADTITVRLSDAQHKYLLEWTIDKGTEIVAKIQSQDWAKPGERLQVDCGSFYVDRIDYSSNPSVVDIKATSIPVSRP